MSYIYLLLSFVFAAHAGLDFEKVEKGVVRIEHTIYGVPFGSGSGFFVTKEGHVLTNRHVLEPFFSGTGTSTLNVVLKSGVRFRTAQVEFLGCSKVPTLDLCLVRVNAKPDYVFSFNVVPQKKGQKLFLIGHPMDMKWSLSEGIVSGYQEMDRKNFSLLGLQSEARKVEFLQTTAPTSPGNSGGPLFDPSGKVVGVMTMVMSQLVGAQNINFAVSAKEVRPFLDEFMKQPVRSLAEARKEFLAEEDKTAEKVMNTFVKPALQRIRQRKPPFTDWVMQTLEAEGRSVEFGAPQGACTSTPSKVGAAVKCLFGSMGGVAVVFEPASKPLLELANKEVSKPAPLPMLQEAMRGDNWKDIDKALKPAERKFLNTVPGKFKCRKKGWDYTPVGEWNVCRASIYNFPGLGGVTSFTRVQDPETKMTVTIVSEAPMARRKVVAEGLAEMILQSLQLPEAEEQMNGARGPASLEEELDQEPEEPARKTKKKRKKKKH